MDIPELEVNNDMTIAFRATLYEKMCDYHKNCCKEIEKMNEFVSSLPENTKHKNYAFTLQLYSLMSCMEIFLSSCAIDFLTAYPCSIKKAKIDRNEVGPMESLTALVNYFAKKEVNELAYQSALDHIKGVYERFNVKFGETLDSAELEIFIEAKARRDILMHNGGITNYIYVQRTKDCKTRAVEINKHVSLDVKYMSEVEDVVKKIISDFFTRCVKKYSMDTKVNIFKKMWELSSLSKNVPFDKQWEILPSNILLIKRYKFGWSGTEQLLFNFFRHIHASCKSGYQTKQMNIRDIGNALYYWKGYPDERIILSWLESPFML